VPRIPASRRTSKHAFRILPISRPRKGGLLGGEQKGRPNAVSTRKPTNCLLLRKPIGGGRRFQGATARMKARFAFPGSFRFVATGTGLPPARRSGPHSGGLRGGRV
jgi:hypothetical protein